MYFIAGPALQERETEVQHEGGAWRQAETCSQTCQLKPYTARARINSDYSYPHTWQTEINRTPTCCIAFRHEKIHT